jgi:hypothetical protein
MSPSTTRQQRHRPNNKSRHYQPVIHRVLIEGNITFYVYGFLARSNVLPDVPMMWLEDPNELVAILPEQCVVERWTRGEVLARDWSVVYSPPAGIDVSWLTNHPDWQVA